MTVIQNLQYLYKASNESQNTLFLVNLVDKVAKEQNLINEDADSDNAEKKTKKKQKKGSPKSNATSSLKTSVLSYTTDGKEKSSDSLESSDIDWSEKTDSDGRRKEIAAFLDS